MVSPVLPSGLYYFPSAMTPAWQGRVGVTPKMAAGAPLLVGTSCWHDFLDGSQGLDPGGGAVVV